MIVSIFTAVIYEQLITTADNLQHKITKSSVILIVTKVSVILIARTVQFRYILFQYLLLFLSTAILEYLAPILI